MSKDRHGNGHRQRQGEVLFIDARKLGRMENRRLRLLDDDDIAKITSTYHAWRNHGGCYLDEPGFAKVASLEEIKLHDFVLTPGRYVGAEEAEIDDESVGQKITRITEELRAEFRRGRELELEVLRQLEALR